MSNDADDDDDEEQVSDDDDDDDLSRSMGLKDDGIDINDELQDPENPHETIACID